MANNYRLYLTDNFNNKLFCNAFAVLKPADDKLYPVGQVFDVFYAPKGTKSGEKYFVGTAILKTKRNIEIEKLNNFMCYLDSGYDLENTKRMMLRMWGKEKSSVLMYGCFLWTSRTAVDLPLRGTVGKAYKKAGRSITAKVEREASNEDRLAEISRKHTGKDQATIFDGGPRPNMLDPE